MRVGPQTCQEAAYYGHLEVLKYCRLVADPICEWTQRTTAAAANAGTPRWRVLRWLRTQHTPPCPWTIWTLNRARAHFGAEVVAAWPENEKDQGRPGSLGYRSGFQ